MRAKRAALRCSQVVSVYRGRRERFWQFTLQRPFGDDTWYLQVKVPLQNEKKEFSEIKELLHRMAFDLGAVSTSDEGGLGEEGRFALGEQLRALERLQRLEQRFAGSGVTESEARNALRLFERELSKGSEVSVLSIQRPGSWKVSIPVSEANWSEEKFAHDARELRKLKRQLAGAEEWSAADLVAECCVRWTEGIHRDHGKRRQAWFSSACARLAAPLGIESGYTENGGGTGGGVNNGRPDWQSWLERGPSTCRIGCARSIAAITHHTEDFGRSAGRRTAVVAVAGLQLRRRHRGVAREFIRRWVPPKPAKHGPAFGRRTSWLGATNSSTARSCYGFIHLSQSGSR
ncbi:Molybdenum cofactor sulfurase [Durusdinium trenchii]|uniref:Molybdenum cofactor sulfurase n=1 Tax=Durusdinium trenchii TaxID=1381693 RepID=A0ABP0QAQ2_9DINO